MLLSEQILSNRSCPVTKVGGLRGEGNFGVILVWVCEPTLKPTAIIYLVFEKNILD